MCWIASFLHFNPASSVDSTSCATHLRGEGSEGPSGARAPKRRACWAPSAAVGRARGDACPGAQAPCVRLLGERRGRCPRLPRPAPGGPRGSRSRLCASPASASPGWLQPASSGWLLLPALPPSQFRGSGIVGGRMGEKSATWEPGGVACARGSGFTDAAPPTPSSGWRLSWNGRPGLGAPTARPVGPPGSPALACAFPARGSRPRPVPSVAHPTVSRNANV